MRGSPRVVIIGGGYVGLYAGLVLQRKLGHGVDLTLVSTESHMTYQPFLPEVAGAAIEPRHVAIPLRRVLKKARVLVGSATAIDRQNQVVTVRPVSGNQIEVPYDHLVIGMGSVSRVLPIPGLAERGIGFKTIAEAIYLRNHVLQNIDAAEAMTGEDKRAALTFVFVGAGYAGVEAIAELEDLAREATRYVPRVSREEMTWILVEASDRILPEVGPGLGKYTLDVLKQRGIEVWLNTRLQSAEGGVLSLSNGQTVRAETLVWTAGIKGHPLSSGFGLPRDPRGRVLVDAQMRGVGLPNVWAAGDCAAVPEAAGGGVSPPTAQHALRQGRRLGKNIAAMVQGRQPEAFRYRQLGTLASLGRHRGVARVLGVQLRGLPAWLLHRTYHLLMLPTWGRRARVALDWTVALFFRRDIVSLGSLEQPRRAFIEASAPGEDE